MRMNSRFLSGFLLSVILAAGMNCRALADSAENNASESVYTEQAEQADLGEGDNNASPDVSQDASDHSEDVSGEDSQLKRQTPTARIPTGKTPPKISKRKVPPKSPVKIPRKTISMPPRPQAPTMNWAACSPLFFQRP